MPGPLDPIGTALRRAILLRRYENELAARAGAILAQAREALTQILLLQDPTDVSAGRVQARVRSLTAKADDILVKAYSELNALTREQLVQLGVTRANQVARDLERQLQAALIDATEVRLPTRAVFRALVTEQPVRGAVMYDWWRRQRLQTRHAFRTQVQLGITNGESVDDMVRRVRGRFVRRGVYEGGVLQVSTRQAEALVRTSVNQIANAAAFETYQANEDLTQEYELVATLDARTTEICANLDGERFRYDDPQGKRPPFHWNCRTTMVPVINYKALGVRPPKEEPRELYPDWFARQPAAKQDEILGPRRAALVRSGSASLADLVRQDGSRVSLEELEAA
jgi:SPP1 gp7 family putative phage head morphogenesis protein